MSTRLVWCSPAGAPKPTPALLTSTSRRPNASRCAATAVAISSSLVRSAATSTTSWPAARSSSTASASFSGRRATTVRRVALLAQRVRDREPDSTRASGDERGAVWHGAGVLSVRGPAIQSGMRMPLTVIAVLIVALLGLWAVTEDEEGVAAPAAAPVDVIARRVEALRSLRFTRLPEPVTVSSRQAEREGLADLDRNYPARAPRGRRGDLQAARADRPRRGPARDQPVAVRRRAWPATTTRPTDGCGWSKAPAPAPACSRRWCSPTSSRTRSRTSASGSPPSRRRPTTASSPAPPCTRGARPRSCTPTCRSTSASRRRSAGCSARRSRTPATCRRSSRRSCCSRTSAASASSPSCSSAAAGAGRWSTPRSACGRRRRPSRSSTRARTSRPTSRAGCGCARGRCSGAAGRAHGPAPGASCRRASCCAPRTPRRAGAATATSSGGRRSRACS